MLSRLVSSPRHASMAVVGARGLRFRPPVHVGVIGFAPRLFHTSFISRSGTEPDATPGRIRAQEPFKDAARQAAEEVSKMAKSVKDAARPGGNPDQDVDPNRSGMTEEGATTRTRESVVNLIKKDHTNIGRLYRVYKNVSDADTKLLMGQSIIREICIHSNAEEMEVYPVIDSDISHDQAEQARNDHASIESILKEIDGASTWDDTYDNRLNTAMQSLRRHIDFEESELLKLLESREKPERLMELGDSFEDAKASAPTRPHPLAPKSGILGKAAKMATKPLDEMRDSARFAGREADVEAARARAESNTPPPA